MITNTKSTNTNYLFWIKDYKKPIRNRCWVVCHEMMKVFPELTLQGGTVTTEESNGNIHITHFWLVDSEGFIVDPTERQFYVILNYYLDDSFKK